MGTAVAIENDAEWLLEKLHNQSMAAIGAEAKSSSFFDALPGHFRAGIDYDIFVARVDDAPVAALLIFYTGTAADYYLPAVLPESRAGQPMALVLKTAMLHAAERGITHWNSGGSPPGHETLQQFKAKWGGEPSEYRYWTKINDPALFSTTPSDLRSGYPGFFVVPYDRLDGEARRRAC